MCGITMRALASVACALSLAMGSLLLGGCQWKGGNEKPLLDLSVLDGSSWRPTAAQMRVYPSTRFVVEDGRTLLDTRIELLDEMSDAVKAPGRFHFQILPPTMAGDPSVGRRLYAWHAALLTLEQQKSSWDPVARAYVFRLRVDDPAIARRDMTLKVDFDPVGGRTLTAQASIPGLIGAAATPAPPFPATAPGSAPPPGKLPP